MIREGTDIFFNKIPSSSIEARERSFASLLPSSTLFNFFKYLNSSHSDQHFPPFLFPTISNREFLQDEFVQKIRSKIRFGTSSNLLFRNIEIIPLIRRRRKQIDVMNESSFSTVRRTLHNERFRRIGKRFLNTKSRFIFQDQQHQRRGFQLALVKVSSTCFGDEKFPPCARISAIMSLHSKNWTFIGEELFIGDIYSEFQTADTSRI